MGRFNTLLLSFLLMTLARPALACRCVEPSIQTSYERADGIAQVLIQSVSTASPDGTVIAEGEIIRAWKTDLPSHIKIVTGEVCAYPFQTKETYVLYLFKGNDSWGTYLCRGNRALSEAHKTILWLNRYGRAVKPN